MIYGVTDVHLIQKMTMISIQPFLLCQGQKISTYAKPQASSLISSTKFA